MDELGIKVGVYMDSIVDRQTEYLSPPLPPNLISETNDPQGINSSSTVGIAQEREQSEVNKRDPSHNLY